MALETDVLRLSSSGREDHGHTHLEPGTSVVAGTYGTWRLVYTVGPRGVSTGGRIRIDTDSDTDWGWPQVHDPSGPDYLTVDAPDGAELALRLLDHVSLLLVVTGRPLAPGEEVAVTYGDRRGGSPGSRAQTFLEESHHLWVEVDAKGTGEFAPLPALPKLKIVGGDAIRLVVVAPSTAVVGEPFRLVVKAEDEWGNPATAYRGRVRLEAAGVALPSVEFELMEAHGGVRCVEDVSVMEPGVYRIAARDTAAGLAAMSNPVVATATAPPFRLHWGDPHGGQVVDPRKIGEFLRYARDVAGIDFVGFQRNDHVMTSAAYARQQEFERAFYMPGRFVPLPGYEWSGELERGGHHNVYFRRFDQPIRRSSHWGEVDRSDEQTDLPHVQDLHREYRQADVVITPHVGGVHADLAYHEPTLEPAVEVTSTHGTFEWFLRETLERRYKLGFVGGSDCYTGRPGDDRPGHQLRRYAKAGLTAVYARQLTLESVLEGIRARRCYATTGVRIVAAVSADGHLMGAEYLTATPPEIQVSVAGTAPVETVEIYRGLDLIHHHTLDQGLAPNRIRILWQGASRKSSYSGIVWDGRVRVTGGRITALGKIRFDSPRSTVTREGERGARWHAWTCGYRSGLTLDIDGGRDARVEVIVSCSAITGARFGGHGEAMPQRISFAPVDRIRLEVGLAELESGPRVIDLGILDRAISVGLAPEPGRQDVEFSLRDPSIAPGVNPYWVRVIQSDMEIAWTSPVFVDYAPDPRGP